MSTILIRETSTVGTNSKTYTLTTTKPSDSNTTPKTRLDVVPSEIEATKRSIATSTTQSFISEYVAPYFLPIGYPHTVSPDYTAYQIYDSLQAFASTIAGLLSSRAVLQSLGMDTEGSGTSTATYATLLSIARSTISNLATIVFADHMSSRISGEVKFYRFFADITNDAGFLLEMVSPSLPDYLRMPCLCLSSALRAICGVAGGSSKAILSAHFALDGNIGDLNAKDGSQETLLNLIGMWIGGVVVSKVEGLRATWCWMIVLLSLHLWFNWLAVANVRLRGLNMGRAGMVLRTLIQEGQCEGINDIGRREKVFEKNGVVRDQDGNLLLQGSMGVDFKTLLRLTGSRKQAGSGSDTTDNDIVQRLVNVFAKEQYLLWVAPSDRRAVIVLKDGATRDDQLKSWCHAIRISCEWNRKHENESEMFRLVSETLMSNSSAWQDFRSRIEDAGWDLSATTLESTPGVRMSLLAVNN